VHRFSVEYTRQQIESVKVLNELFLLAELEVFEDFLCCFVFVDCDDYLPRELLRWGLQIAGLR
jgi:hypothetical protein